MKYLNSVHDYFISNGFIKITCDEDLPEELAKQFDQYNFLYRGIILVNQGKYKVDIVIGFQSIPFNSWPKCFLVDPSEVMKYSQAHVESNGDYCYIDSETNNLDISRPIESLIFTIETIQNRLESSFEGNNKNDIAIELPSYLESQFITELYNNNEDFECFEYNVAGTVRCIIRPSKLDSEIISLLWPPSKYKLVKKLSFIKITIDSPPNSNEDLPIKSLSSLLKWLEKNQARALAKLTPQIYKFVKNKNESDKIAILFTYKISGDKINFAFILSFNSIGLNLIKGTNVKRLRRVMSAWNDKICTESFFSSRVINVNPVDGVKRNIPERNLLNLRIALIGAGTLGGYVSEQLVNLGAGLNSKNKNASIDIFDSGTLEPDNISRHFLGYSSLWENKAIALANKLRNDNPLLLKTIRGIAQKISSDNFTVLQNYDIVINATGDQHSTDILNYHWYATSIISYPIIHGWIEGSGLASRVIKLHNKTSCFRCLRELNNKPRYQIFKHGNNDLPSIRKACGMSYIPFPPTISIRSASLIVEAVLDAIHLNNDNYIYFDRMSEKIVIHKNQKLKNHKRCPVCS